MTRTKFLRSARSRGSAFTLVELLVVIAIIGILAAVVLASLSTAREKGKIAAFKSEMQQVAAEGAIQCDSVPTGDVTASSTSNHPAVSFSCDDFYSGAGGNISSSIPNVTCDANVSINGAKFSGADC